MTEEQEDKITHKDLCEMMIELWETAEWIKADDYKEWIEPEEEQE